MHHAPLLLLALLAPPQGDDLFRLRGEFGESRPVYVANVGDRDSDGFEDCVLVGWGIDFFQV